ncbi:hypothetical protein FW778_06250 [Ginsengibacter hankyongi]|uniref:Uncharacterized protein n=1 Tax=Ginsengibacter hankyongi TaxID=2607284 RepID=A0A5J5IKV6_9BACT|nr:hypothetical protein [Ginsengibacter hankyongi]KAA9041619.1 hypothetical protein FW778_06250 [Ginsengibacter hankyongi]
MIKISELSLITDAKTFFETDKILSMDVFCIDSLPAVQKLILEAKDASFKYRGNLYMPLIFKGSPENWFLNLKQGFPAKVAGQEMTIFFDGNLNSLLRQKKVYDLTRHYKKGEVKIAKEIDFFIERYITPYEAKGYSFHNLSIPQIGSNKITSITCK